MLIKIAYKYQKQISAEQPFIIPKRKPSAKKKKCSQQNDHDYRRIGLYISNYIYVKTSNLYLMVVDNSKTEVGVQYCNYFSYQQLIKTRDFTINMIDIKYIFSKT